jgi:hypothetical protein
MVNVILLNLLYQLSLSWLYLEIHHPHVNNNFATSHLDVLMAMNHVYGNYIKDNE